ncbi:hypothetical protein [Dactylosporangium sp. NPDC051541]|uniref:hypothetical protein n=1 Tax=Dactylosporangium sp. NPDC051541 TaxID=3363977 RepID=UPI00378B1424
MPHPNGVPLFAALGVDGVWTAAVRPALVPARGMIGLGPVLVARPRVSRRG